MRLRTLFALAALVTVLFLLWRAKERESARGGPALSQFPLFPGLSPERVRSLRIDHLERSIQVKLERDAAGRWFLTDPVAYPAQDSLVRSLLQTLAGAQGEPAGEVEPSSVALDPPLVLLEYVQVEPEGERTARLELGAVDRDPSFVFARVPGHPLAPADERGSIFRTTRTLVTTLDRNPDDYRDPRATALFAQQVTSLRRRGQVFLAEEGRRIDLAFDALLEPEGWKQVAPQRVSLDPSAIQLLARGAAELQVERFADDSPSAPERHGLDRPALTVELEDERGAPTVLCFGHGLAGAEGDRPIEELTWFCQRQGFAHVWEVGARDVALLCRPASLFFDYDVLRVFRQDVARLELEGDARTLVLERDGERWTVQERRAGAVEGGEPPRYPAHPGAVEDALALLERTQLGDYQVGVPFAEEEPPLAFTVVTTRGERLGGRIGRAARDERSGAQGRLFLRHGDELVGLIGEEVAALCRRPLDDLRAKKLHQIQESLVRWIDLEHGGRTYSFVNSGDNVWSPRGRSISAPADFLQSLDGLLNLTASRWLEPGGEAPADALVVLVHPLSGDELRFTLGRDAAGTSLYLSADGERAEIDGALLERLLRLF